MISFPASADIFICHKPVSFGCGIDGMLRYCRIIIQKEPICSAYFMFVNKSQKQLRVIWYDGQGFTLCTKRSSAGSFSNWPKKTEEIGQVLTCFDAQIIYSGGDYKTAKTKKLWKKLD